MFMKLKEKDNVRESLSTMAQYLTTHFMISNVENEYLVKIKNGIV